MATGYTACVEDGTATTLREFGLVCARAMGPLAEMREYPWDAVFPEVLGKRQVEYAEQRLADAEAELKQFSGMEMIEAATLCVESHARQMRQHLHDVMQRRLSAQRFKQMLEQVEGWTPPGIEHKNLHDFMLSQLRQSLEELNLDAEVTPPVKPHVWDWLNDRISYAQRRVEECKRDLETAKEGSVYKTAWLKALDASLPDLSSPGWIARCTSTGTPA